MIDGVTLNKITTTKKPTTTKVKATRTENTQYSADGITVEKENANNAEKEDKLIDDMILDSFDIVTLVSEIGEKFDVEILAEHLVAENFNSAEAMYNLIQQLENE